MPRLQSIKQNHLPETLPNFRNLGVALRSVLLTNGAMLLLALFHATSWANVVQQFIDGAALLQPVLLSCLLLLYVLNAQLERLSYRRGVAAVLSIVALVTFGIVQVAGDLYLPPFGQDEFSRWRYVLLGVAVSGLLLSYLRLRALALSPAIYEARLQALQARIRPHFLFNCINTVLGVVRADPKQAETALEDMADLFRMAMGHGHELVPLSEEIGLSRRYLALEQLRLGDRLKVSWHIEGVPNDALTPPLILQPLLENAVYHGIEPLAEGGSIDIRVERRANEIHLEIYNPCRESNKYRSGNKLALANIRERLALLFDIEATYAVERGKDFYRVHIVMPYVKREPG
jgi:two-component system sensor histidine kinase AlgZ